jgi:hypothetical protein
MTHDSVKKGHAILIRHTEVAASILALALAAHAVPAQSQSSGGPLAISPATQGEITAYLAKVKSTRPGAFAVSPDGRTSYYTWCDNTVCRISTYSIPALNKCQSLAGAKCLVLYVRRDKRVDYKVDTDIAPGGQHGAQQQEEFNFDVHDRRAS